MPGPSEIPFYAEFDNGRDFDLPDGWADDIKRVALARSTEVSSEPTSSTSARNSTIPLKYKVVDGEKVRTHLNWLHSFYVTEFRDLAQQVVGDDHQIVTSQNVVTGMNLNVMIGQSHSYEWHYDSNPLTGLLFVTSHRDGAGGDLAFRLGRTEVTIRPKQGRLLFFDARNTQHHVRSLTGSRSIRITAPMNFYFRDEEYRRPTDLDRHIFGGTD